MKQGLLVILALVLAINYGQAQERPNADRMGKNAAEMDEFFEEIGVSEAQMQEIEKARTEMRDAMDELRGQGKGRSQEGREKMQSIKDNHTAKMKSILNDEQYSKWEVKANRYQKKRHQHYKRPN